MPGYRRHCVTLGPVFSVMTIRVGIVVKRKVALCNLYVTRVIVLVLH
jgi:hypothetical protein